MIRVIVKPDFHFEEDFELSEFNNKSIESVRMDAISQISSGNMPEAKIGLISDINIIWVKDE